MSGASRPGFRALALDALPGLFVLSAILAAQLAASPGVWRGEMVDPDSYMVLARLKQVLADGGWSGGLFPRDNAPYGMVLHWSKAYDLIFLALAAPIAALAGWNAALAAVAAVIGPLGIVALILAAAWAAAPVLETPGRRFLAMVLALAPTVVNYGTPGSATHHIPIVVGWVAFMGFALRVAARPDQARGIGAGVAAAAALWLSTECIPGVMLGISTMGLAWVREGGAHRRPNLVFAAAFAALTIALLQFDPPYGGRLAPVADRLSVVYAAFALLLLLLWLALALAPQRAGAWPARLAVAAIGSALSAFLLWFLFPHLLAPETAVFGPELGPRFWGLIDEMRPSYRDLHTLLLLMGGPAIGLAAATAFAWARPGAGRWAWAWLALMQAALMVPGLLHARFAVYPQVLGALPTAALLAGIGPLLERLSAPSLRLPVRALAIALIVVGPLLAAGLAGKERAPARPVAGNCSVRGVAAALDDPGFMGGTNLILLTHPDQAPETLYWTGHRVVAGLYHLNVDGLSDAVAVATARDDAKAREILERRGVAYVLVCAAAPPPGTGRDEAQLFHRLERGAAPEWLEARPWPAPIKSGLRLYRVLPSG
jgi:hypothetical protein